MTLNPSDVSPDVAALNPDVFGKPSLSPSRRAKYLSNKCEYKGRIYDSEWECQHAQELDLMLKAGQIAGWTANFGIMLRDGIMMFVDFLVLKPDGTAELHECKSDKTKTAVYRMKKRQFHAMYPAIKFVELVKPSWGKK